MAKNKAPGYMNRILIINASVINEDKVTEEDLLIEDDVIRSIMPRGEGKRYAEEGTTVIDADGLWLLPGIIDDQVHFREPGLTHKGDICSESLAAVAGGITSFMDMPNTIPQTITIDEWNRKNKTADEKSLINYSFYLGATNTNFDELLKADPGKICGIKVFLGASTGNMLVDNDDALEKIFSLKRFPVACHCEDETIIRENAKAYMEEYGNEIEPSFHPLIRSREACLASSSAAVSRARRLDTRLHLLHLSTADETELLEKGIPLAEKKITGEVCVHHLWFDDSAYATKGNLIKWNPAIKKRSDREALINAVIDDRIDIIATDHAPHTINEKSGSYFNTPSGGPLVQHSLVMMLELCHRGIFSPQMVVRKMCHNPAMLFNIKERGYIRKGYKADIVLVHPDAPWKVTPENILYKCGWSPLEGTEFRSRVITTLVNGIPVYHNGQFTGKRAVQMLTFNR